MAIVWRKIVASVWDSIPGILGQHAEGQSCVSGYWRVPLFLFTSKFVGKRSLKPRSWLELWLRPTVWSQGIWILFSSAMDFLHDLWQVSLTSQGLSFPICEMGMIDTRVSLIHSCGVRCNSSMFCWKSRALPLCTADVNVEWSVLKIFSLMLHFLNTQRNLSSPILK